MAFSLTFVAIIVLRQSGYLVGKPALVLAAVVVVIAPTSSVLARRLFLNLLISMGLLPLTWWIREDLIGIDHGSLVLAITAGTVAGWIFARPFEGQRWRRLLPKVRGIDLLPVAGAALSAGSLWTMLRVSRPEDALSLFLTRWDYQSHFNIYEMLRMHGAVIPIIPRQSPGMGWGFAEYPQGFHALVATIAEIRGPRLSTLDLELVSFMQLQAFVAVLTITMLLAGLCAINQVRKRAIVLAPFLGVTAAVWIYGPGSIPMYEGFANFYLACGMAVAAAMVLFIFSRKMPVIGMTAISAALVGVFNNWFVLATLFAIPLAFFFWRKLAGIGRLGRRGRLVAGSWSAVTAVGCILPLIQAGPIIAQSSAVVNALGGIAPPDLGLAIASISAVMFFGICNVGRHPNFAVRRDRAISSQLALGLVFPVFLSICLAVSQIQQNGQIAYYFYKYVIAIMLFAWPAATVAFATLLPSRAEAFLRRPPARFKIALGLLAASATQIFGFSVTGLEDIGLAPTASPVVQMLQQRKHLEITPDNVRRLLDSAKMVQPADTVYIASSKSLDPILAARWQWGMRGTATQKTTDMSSYLARLHKVPSEDASVVVELLRANEGTTALVDQELYEELTPLMTKKGIDGRIIPVVSP
ncbi:hypothetical protein [Arthrobacter sp. UYEF3]|uniref:hypothetical protein n=1 Tax=Arthrobacter sp. UYEF3 TaxID=1756365 RepID=UPI0033925DCD